MRIFVLTAIYELRVSRKSHLRDHPTFHSGDPDMIIPCTLSVWLCKAHILARQWQTHATADDTSLLNTAHVQYQLGNGESTVAKTAETQTSIRIASHSVRAPNS